MERGTEMLSTNRVIGALVALTLVMQAAILYHQHSTPSSVAPPQPEPVRDAPQEAILDSKDLPSAGNSASRVVLVEFSDYECPYCQRHAAGVGREVTERFVSPGKIRHIFVNNPLDMHPNAKFLATAAMCAGEQGHYWEMSEAIFNSKPKTESDVMPLLKRLKLEDGVFRECLDSPEAEKRIARDRNSAKTLGLSGTPAFAIGIADSQGRIRLKKFITGAQPIEVFDEVISQMLKDQV
jgi:protein-disulfide isomerase